MPWATTKAARGAAPELHFRSATAWPSGRSRVDVRSSTGQDEGRIPGAQNIPLNSLPDKLDDLAELKDQEIVVHCKSGSRSASAKAFLTQQGFTNVRNLLGGYQGYSAEGQ